MHPGKAFRHRPRLVALQRADEMPIELQCGQFGSLVDGFLHVVLAEGALARCGRFAHAGRRPGLGNRQQLHGIHRPSRGSTGGGDACTHGLQVGGD